jgi:Domain of unknown function (DUF4330)
MSPFIDDRGRLFGRVSVVDIIVLLLIVAVAAFAWGRFAGDQTKIKDYRMVLYVASIRDPTVTQSNEGDKVRDDTGAVLGRIEKVDLARTPTEVPTALGDLIEKPSPVFQQIVITIKGQAQVSGPHGQETVMVGGTVLRAGTSLVLVGPGGSHNYEVKTVINSVGVAK